MFKLFKYPQYRILEKTDQYGAKVFIPQVKKSLIWSSATDIVEGLWRCLDLKQGVSKDWSSVCECLWGVSTHEEAAKIIKVRKLQDKQDTEKQILEQKEKKEKDKIAPKFKVTNKTYL